MDKTQLIEQIVAIEKKRDLLVKLQEKPDLGPLQLDVEQALEELDELIAEFKATFPQG